MLNDGPYLQKVKYKKQPRKIKREVVAGAGGGGGVAVS